MWELWKCNSRVWQDDKWTLGFNSHFTKLKSNKQKSIYLFVYISRAIFFPFFSTFFFSEESLYRFFFLQHENGFNYLCVWKRQFGGKQGGNVEHLSRTKLQKVYSFEKEIPMLLFKILQSHYFRSILSPFLLLHSSALETLGKTVAFLAFRFDHLCYLACVPFMQIEFN